MTTAILTGHSSIAGRSVPRTGTALYAIAPATDEPLEPPY
jgi:NADP-dependent aldehyde dehydrogenase